LSAAEGTPFGVYIHWPFCLSKCPYCDFNSHVRQAGIDEPRYVRAFTAEIAATAARVPGRAVSTIFFGGGTPSLMDPKTVGAILEGIGRHWTIAPDAEITLEANPGTFERARFSGFRAAGINRLSVGVQSFEPKFLHALGRVHDADEARAAAAAAIEIFGNVNLDLMYALPGQTPADAQSDLAQALRFSPPHLSFYHLTIEPNTLFHRYPPSLPDDETAADIEDAIAATLGAAGYLHYETSAYARPGHECRHNLNYWRFGDYLGIGAGAHSKLSFPERVVRQVRHKQPQQYMEEVERGSPLAEDRTVERGEIGFEFMLNALRLTDGVPVALFAERTGFALTLVQKGLDEAERRGLIERDHQRMRPTPLGQRFLNDLQAIFLPAPAAVAAETVARPVKLVRAKP